MVGFGISGVEPPCSAARELVSNLYSHSHETAYQCKLQVYAIFEQDSPPSYQCSLPPGALHTPLLPV